MNDPYILRFAQLIGGCAIKNENLFRAQGRLQQIERRATNQDFEIDRFYGAAAFGINNLESLPRQFNLDCLRLAGLLQVISHHGDNHVSRQSSGNLRRDAAEIVVQSQR